MSTRLNTALRDKIVANALTKAGITKDRQELQAARHAWADELRLTALGTTDEALAKLSTKVKKAWESIPSVVARSYSDPIYTREYIYVNLGGLKTCAHFRERAPAPTGSPVFEADHALTIRFHELENAAKDLDDRADTLKTQVRAVVNSVSTVKQLLNVWPEAKELLPATVEESKSKLPAVQVETLNTLIGLPTEEEPK